MLPDTAKASPNPSATAILLPKKGHTTKAPVPRDLPCYTILVHGVNDVGECYNEVERGLCEGLNERLDRTDLTHALYSVPTDPEKVDPNPDDAYYHRQPVSETWSPVIPFYWGFREVEKFVKKHERHGEWLDRSGNRLDKHGSKGGGPFSNATNNIPDVFGTAFKEKIAGIVSKDKLSQRHGGSPTHPLLDCPERDYNVLAAKRLAMLITLIRNRHAGNGLPEPTINVLAHSQGNIVTLLAHAILAKEGKRGADGFITCNSTYSLRPLDNKWAKTTTLAEDLQTVDARIETFKNILNFMTGDPVQAPSFKTLSTEGRDRLGLGGERWPDQAVVKGQPHTYTDRDNRGQVHLYFCPEDLTVALPNIQGIGWCGVHDDCLKQFSPCFKQRVWSMKWRDGKPYLVGQKPYSHPLLKKGEDFWGWAHATSRAEPEENTWRWINGESLPVPFEPRLRLGDVNESGDAQKGKQGQLRCSPLDASVAVSHGGINTLPPKAVPDPRTDRKLIPVTDASGFTSAQKQDQTKCLQDYYDKKHLKYNQDGSEDRTDQFDVEDAYSLPDGTLMLTRTESPNEARKRWQKVAEDNSYHSAIMTNSEHHRQATAYDLAVGIASGSKKKWVQERVEDDQAFLKYLCRVADWRVKKKYQSDLFDLDFFKNEKACFADESLFTDLMKATIRYFNTGDLPRDLLPKLVDLPLIVHETMEEQKTRVKGYLKQAEAEGKLLKKGFPL